jgi:NADH oxidoreductase complex rnfABCDGE type, D subunit
MNIQIIKESSPHLRRRDNLFSMMLDVVIALVPTIIFSLVVFKLDALRNILISVLTMELCEFGYIYLIKSRPAYTGKKISLKEWDENFKKTYTINNFMVPLVSALIFALVSPAATNPGYMIYPVLILGSAFGLIIGKFVFGGTGKNIFNPAAVGMVFAKLCFGRFYIYPNNNYYPSYDITAGATPLGPVNYGDKVFDMSQYSLLDLFLGRCPGTIGEVFKITILLGLVYMLIRHTIDWRITFTYLGVFAINMLVAGFILQGSGKYTDFNAFNYMTYHLLSGGLLFGAVFMATDPVTAPLTRPGKVLYGIILGSLTAIIRLFAAYPEGCVFSILLANMMTSVIDYYRWSDDSYNWKKVLVSSVTFIVPLLIVVWAVCVGVL